MADTGVTQREELLSAPIFEAYIYGYPHKTAYRALTPRVNLGALWAKEPKESLFAYIHIPFCEMRCGFCNLFTASRPPDAQVELYLDALERQARVVKNAIGPAVFAQRAIGGGTPTLLSVAQLERIFAVFELLGAGFLPTSVETSPATATLDRLKLLKARGTTRVSIGVQSFFEDEARVLQRPQRNDRVFAALDAIREVGFPTLNIDLIFGTPGQTCESLLGSIQTALRWEPEELYLYPLYVRPLTGMGRKEIERNHQNMLELYRVGRGLLRERGYEQVNLRMFRKALSSSNGDALGRARDPLPQDGMVGLGCGARSYTRSLHYASEYAVAPREIMGIIERWSSQSDEDFASAYHGFWLDEGEQERRGVILSLLESGIEGEVIDGELREKLAILVEEGLAVYEQGRLVLTEWGRERSDAVGPWLHSALVRERMQSYVAR